MLLYLGYGEPSPLNKKVHSLQSSECALTSSNPRSDLWVAGLATSSAKYATDLDDQSTRLCHFGIQMYFWEESWVLGQGLWASPAHIHRLYDLTMARSNNEKQLEGNTNSNLTG